MVEATRNLKWSGVLPVHELQLAIQCFAMLNFLKTLYTSLNASSIHFHIRHCWIFHRDGNSLQSEMEGQWQKKLSGTVWSTKEFCKPSASELKTIYKSILLI